VHLPIDHAKQVVEFEQLIGRQRRRGAPIAHTQHRVRSALQTKATHTTHQKSSQMKDKVCFERGISGMAGAGRSVEKVGVGSGEHS
jgi:hypothetical protein